MNDPHLRKDTHLFWSLKQLDSSWCGITWGMPSSNWCQLSLVCIGEGNSTSQFSPGPTNTQQILGKLLIIEWKIKLVFAIQVFSFNQTNFSKCTSVSRWTMSLSSFGQPMPPSCAFFATFIVSSIGKNIVALINCQKEFQALVLKKRTVNINVKVGKYCILLPGS